jgi:hypothetical protein
MCHRIKREVRFNRIRDNERSLPVLGADERVAVEGRRVMMSGPSHSPADPPRQAQTGSRRKQGCWQGHEDRFLDLIIGTRGLQSDGRRIDPEVGIVPDRDLDDTRGSADLIIRQGGRIEHAAERYRQK